MSRAQERGQVKSQKGREAYDELGCGLCGIHVSSSFRNCPETNGRVCNSCHCKTYRLKRKLCGQPAAAGDTAAAPAATRPRTLQQRRANSSRTPLPTPQAQMLHAPAAPGSPDHQLFDLPNWQPAAAAGGGTAAAAAAAGMPYEAVTAFDAALAAQHQQQQAGGGAQQQQQQPAIPDLQQRVFQEAAAAAAGPHTSVALTLACARRAQQATPSCGHRVVLGVLPSVRLKLPDDPPGLLHSVSCLVEAVTAGDSEAGAEQGADSQDQTCQEAHAHMHERRQQRQRGGGQGQGATEAVAVRLTVFAAAGAVACWHEAPPRPSVSLAFCPLTKAPIWTSGQDGFSLQFPHPFCPQVDMFAAIHRQVAAAGSAVLHHPTLSLAQPLPWDLNAAGGGNGGNGDGDTAATVLPALLPLMDALLPGQGRQLLLHSQHPPLLHSHHQQQQQQHMYPMHHSHQQQQQQGHPHPQLFPPSMLGGGSGSSGRQQQQQEPAVSFGPLQLSFGPMPSGPLLSGGVTPLPGLSGFNM